ncbi:MAG: tyrosine--tRNA ligase, partial [Cytophagales bacterium]
CKLQMGGSDQWGNIVTGTELIRRKSGGEAFAITCPLITKSDGGKFGKTEKGNIWLDPEKTSPYQFYQFWLNASDEDISKWVKIFTLKSKEEIEELLRNHQEKPHERLVQKAVAEELTIRVHSLHDLQNAQKASEILFGKGSFEAIHSLDDKVIHAVFEGVPQVEVTEAEYSSCNDVTEFLSTVTKGIIFPSKGEARKMIEGGGVSVNKSKITDAKAIPTFDRFSNNFILIQKGKKNYFIVKIV